MNGSFYSNPMFPNEARYERDTAYPGEGPDLAMEQSYIENILRLNKGKRATFYMSFTDSISYRDKIFTGIIEQAGRDHIIISDPETGKWYMLLMIYLDFVEFNDKINYK